jgi:hypothetical protein
MRSAKDPQTKDQLIRGHYTSDTVNRATKREWRELGFYYDRHDETRV